jgi:hypothetical protein
VANGNSVDLTEFRMSADHSKRSPALEVEPLSVLNFL